MDEPSKLDYARPTPHYDPPRWAYKFQFVVVFAIVHAITTFSFCFAAYAEKSPGRASSIARVLIMPVALLPLPEFIQDTTSGLLVTIAFNSLLWAIALAFIPNLVSYFVRANRNHGITPEKQK